MNTPAIKAIVSKKRVRNYIAKKLLTEPKFKQQRIEGKRKDVDPLDDYTLLDEWLGEPDGKES